METKQELIKQVVKVGNSAGVILPKNWINGKAKIELIEKPLDIRKDILEIIDPYLPDVKGVYIVGSYARGEQTKESDIDVLVITHETNKKITRGKYDLSLIPEEKIETSLKNNILPIFPMLKEAKSLINESLIKKYKNIKLTKENFKPHVGLTKSALNIIKESIKIDKETGLSSNNAAIYSLILRIREAYIVDCLIKNKLPLKKELINLIKKISGTSKAYESYLRIKNNQKIKNEVSIKEAERLYCYLDNKIKEQEKWAKTKK